MAKQQSNIVARGAGGTGAAAIVTQDYWNPVEELKADNAQLQAQKAKGQEDFMKLSDMQIKTAWDKDLVEYLLPKQNALMDEMTAKYRDGYGRLSGADQLKYKRGQQNLIQLAQLSKMQYDKWLALKKTVESSKEGVYGEETLKNLDMYQSPEKYVGTDITEEEWKKADSNPITWRAMYGDKKRMLIPQSSFDVFKYYDNEVKSLVNEISGGGSEYTVKTGENKGKNIKITEKGVTDSQGKEIIRDLYLTNEGYKREMDAIWEADVENHDKYKSGLEYAQGEHLKYFTRNPKWSMVKSGSGIDQTFSFGSGTGKTDKYAFVTIPSKIAFERKTKGGTETKEKDVANVRINNLKSETENKFYEINTGSKVYDLDKAEVEDATGKSDVQITDIQLRTIPKMADKQQWYVIGVQKVNRGGTEVKKKVAIPLKNAKPDLLAHYGLTQENLNTLLKDAKERFNKTVTSNSSKSSTNSKNEDEKLTADEWSKKWNSLKSGESMVGLDGKTYIKK